MKWGANDVKSNICQAFQATLPDDVDIEIVHSVHTTLLKALAPGQYLTVPWPTGPSLIINQCTSGHAHQF